jgi:S1-C subfamily serine protease
MKKVGRPCSQPTQIPIEMKSAWWLLPSLALTSCRLGELRHRHEDNERVRALQEASLSRYGEKPVAGQSIGAFFKDKVGLIVIKGGSLPVGRAVPVSRDGYYLTAWHGVADVDFRLSDSALLGNRLRVDEYPGRVVWHDSSTDLAIVKFGFRPSAVFRAQGTPLGKGEAVFSGANGRNGGALVTAPNESGIYDLSEVLKKGIGNGPFRTAGEVTGLQTIEGEPARMIYESTLVGRGGMSGAPVVDRKGDLVGIVTGGRAKLFSAPAAAFSMLDPEALESIIRADRQRR